jgi:DNA-binding HxlR family transcriptional regulator
LKKGVPEKNSAPRNCSVGRTLAILSDAWTFLVIREAFFGIRRFEDFREELNMPRGTLSARLQLLTCSGILYRRHYQNFPERFEYLLTEKGLDLYPSFLALMSWGDRWLWGKRQPPLRLQHQGCGRWMASKPACSHCNEEIRPEQVDYHNGPGAGISPSPAVRRVRRVTDPDTFLHGRPCSVARTLRIIGDRWSFLVIREAFFGVRRYHDFCRNLQISTNILADRLRAMLAEEIFLRVPYRGHREQLEYRFTEKGKGLYPSMIAMMHWGDKWLAGTSGPPLILRHRACGQPFHIVMACSYCRRELKARNVKYQSCHSRKEFLRPGRSYRGLARNRLTVTRITPSPK